MGIGFPKRFTRDELGPTLRNTYPVENPETDIGEDAFNGAFHQVAGMNLIVPRVSLVALWNGSSFNILSQEEAWNPRHSQAHPVLARTTAGHYTYTFASTYLDEDGNPISTALVAARVTELSGTSTFANRVEAHAWIDASNPLIAHMQFWRSDGGASDDPKFWLEVL